eukprot:UN15279
MIGLICYRKSQQSLDKIQYEQESWRCHYCNSALVRFAEPSGLRRHVSTLNNLLKKRRSARL